MLYRRLKLTTREKTKVINYIMENFVTSDKPVSHASFILSNGKFLDIANTKELTDVTIPPSHSAVDVVLSRVGLIPPEFIDICGNASLTMRELNAVRINDNVDYPEGSPYIELPQYELTNAQYYALEDYVNYLYDKFHNTYKMLQLGGIDCFPDDYPIKSIDAKDIVKKVKKFYSCSKMYESDNFNHFGDYLNRYY